MNFAWVAWRSDHATYAGVMRLAFLSCFLFACTTEPQLPTGEIQQYVVSSQKLPVTNTDSRTYAVDLNDDGTPDNMVGMIASTLGGMELSPSDGNAQLIDRGEIITLAQLQFAQPTDAIDNVALTLSAGGNPDPLPCDAIDTTCRRHLQGDAHFDVISQSEPMLAPHEGTTLHFGPVRMPVEVAFYGVVVELELIGARVVVSTYVPGSIKGIIAGALDDQQVATKLVPVLANRLEQIVAGQCTTRNEPPSCGCATISSYDARYWLDKLDSSPRDCSITPAEIWNNSGTQTLTAPDVEIDGQWLLSIGIGFDAVPATF